MTNQASALGVILGRHVREAVSGHSLVFEAPFACRLEPLVFLRQLISRQSHVRQICLGYVIGGLIYRCCHRLEERLAIFLTIVYAGCVVFVTNLSEADVQASSTLINCMDNNTNQTKKGSDTGSLNHAPQVPCCT